MKILAFLTAIYIKLVRLTSQNICVNFDVVTKTKQEYQNIIFIFWHGRIALAPSYLKKQGNMYGVTSDNKDGRFVAAVLKYFSAKSIYGSSHLGGMKALKNILKILRTPKNYICITPDGPRGPNMTLSGNVMEIARLTGAAIIPLSYSAKKAKLLNSWDQFMIPRLFNHITVEFGEAVFVKRDLDKKQLAALQQKLEDNLNEITWRLDKNYGIKKIAKGAEKKGR